MAKPEVIEVSAEQFNELIARLESLESQVQALTAPKSSDVKEMKDADALRFLNGDLADKKHNEVARLTGFSYGQIYSCRLEFTFKHLHKTLKEQGFKNPWVK